MTNTELAILGLVAEQPRHGYQIERDISARGMRDWTEIGFSSIYYVLNKLEDNGWLSSAGAGKEAVPPGAPRRGGPARKVFHLTEAGREGLRAAVRERLANPRPRTGDFDLALANLPVLSPQEARAALETYQAALQQRLAAVREKWSQDRAAQQGEQPFPPHVNALFDHSIAALEAEMGWVGRYLKERYPVIR